jgi:hypothetical protein
LRLIVFSVRYELDFDILFRRSSAFKIPMWRRVQIFTVALRVVGGDEKGTQCMGCNWATLFLGDINTRTWLSRF